MVKLSKFYSESFHHASAIDMLCSNFVKCGRREIGKIVRCLPDKKLSPGSPAVATGRMAPKIGQGQPLTRFYQNWFTSGGVIVAESVNTAKARRAP